MSEHKEPVEERVPLTPDDTAAPEESAEDGKKKLSFAAESYTWLQSLIIALVTLMVVFTFFGRVIGVEGSSMYPTLEDGDMLMLRSIGYQPEQGDIVVLQKDFADIEYPIVKRIVATGGQTVEIDYNTSTVYVDGVPLDEPYLGEPMQVPGSAYEQGTYWEVPEGSVFVMGDNRNASSDSRHMELGTVDERHILGKAFFVILPFQHIGTVE